MGKVSGHSSNSSVVHCSEENQTDIKFIPFRGIPVKPLDALLMDFCAFCLLKEALGRQHPQTVKGLWKVAKEEWKKIDMTVRKKKSNLQGKFEPELKPRIKAIQLNQINKINTAFIHRN